MIENKMGRDNNLLDVNNGGGGGQGGGGGEY